MAKDWKRVSVCMSPAEFQVFRVFSAQCNMSISLAIRVAMRAQLVSNGYVDPFPDSVSKTAKPS